MILRIPLIAAMLAAIALGSISVLRDASRQSTGNTAPEVTSQSPTRTSVAMGGEPVALDLAQPIAPPPPLGDGSRPESRDGASSPAARSASPFTASAIVASWG